MPILKDHVQILRVQEQSNSSQILVVLGRRLGQVRVMAKGARRWPKKGFEGGFDLLARGELLAYPRPDEQLWIFKEWDERARPALGQSYRMLAAASFLCELAEALTRHTAGSVREIGAAPSHESENARLFDLLEASTEALSAHALEPGIVLLNFSLNALAAEGLLPDLERCHNCGDEFFATAPKRNRATQAPPKPHRRAWVSYQGLECEPCFQSRHSQAKGPADFTSAERGIWLETQAHRALLHIQRTLKPITLSKSSWTQLAATQALLIHGALERDLRTLPYASSIIRAMK